MMYMYPWPVVPICDAQKLDVKPEDLLEDGLYRKCRVTETKMYDRFPALAEARFGPGSYDLHFIAQLRGCHLNCPYCYVTQEGIWGEATKVDTVDLVDAFARAAGEHACTVFHLMGGAPALHIVHWHEIAALLSLQVPEAVFHSDMLLTEGMYNASMLQDLAMANWRALYAVNIKGLTDEEHCNNTGRPLDKEPFWHNLEALEIARVPFYITFTAVEEWHIEWFWDRYDELYGSTLSEKRRADAFSIELVAYQAIDAAKGGDVRNGEAEARRPAVGGAQHSGSVHPGRGPEEQALATAGDQPGA